MNKDNARDYLPLVQALADGKVIQIARTAGGWIDVKEIDSVLDVSNYRIKPEPREFWVNRYPDDSESTARFSSERSAILATNDPKATQVRYREVIE